MSYNILFIILYVCIVDISNTNNVQTSDKEEFYGKKAILYGWGATSQGGDVSSVLLEVDM